ncbi:MAG: CHAT domain-containing protein [Chromatiales bacterium]
MPLKPRKATKEPPWAWREWRAKGRRSQRDGERLAVSDVSTPRLVSLFFENLQSSRLNKAQALQRAQQQLLAEGEYKHPFHWAPFVLIGNWL